MKRVRDEKYNRKNGIKLNSVGKVIYHCLYCKFIACTEGNIETHVKTKHLASSPNPSPTMLDSSFKN
jgi:hypothetical protein